MHFQSDYALLALQITSDEIILTFCVPGLQIRITVKNFSGSLSGGESGWGRGQVGEKERTKKKILF